MGKVRDIFSWGTIDLGHQLFAKSSHISISIHIYPYLSISIHIYPYLSISIHIYPYLSISIHIYPYLSHEITMKSPWNHHGFLGEKKHAMKKPTPFASPRWGHDGNWANARLVPGRWSCARRWGAATPKMGGILGRCVQFVLPSGELTFCYGKSPFLMGKSTISMAIFHCYVSSPEGTWFDVDDVICFVVSLPLNQVCLLVCGLLGMLSSC